VSSNGTSKTGHQLSSATTIDMPVEAPFRPSLDAISRPRRAASSAADESRIYGDGINIAARLESLAEPGVICISSKVHEDVRGKADLTYDDMGEQQLKNIAQSVRCYRVRGIKEPSYLLGDAKGLALPDKPSIAVLPFTNLSDDPDQVYFGDGIAEDILTETSETALAVCHCSQLQLHFSRQSS
jgi:Adenylate and Guanylate cyclase catalytic domain